MKKLTTKQKLYNIWHNEKFKKVRDIILFVSLGINILIFVLFGFVGCSTKPYQYDHSAKTDNTQLIVKNKKEINNSFNLYDNNNVFAWNFTTFTDNIHEATTYGHGDYVELYQDIYISNGYCLINRGANEELVNISTLTFNLKIDINNDSRCEFLIRYNGVEDWYCLYKVNNGHWYNDFFDSTKLGKLFINVDNVPSLYLDFLNDLFEPITYKNYDLSYNWSPYGYFPISGQGVIEYAGDYNAHVVNILQHCVFSINGKLYTKLYITLFTLQASGYIDGEGHFSTWTAGYGYYPGNLVAGNTTTNDSLILGQVDSVYLTKDNTTSLYIKLGSFSFTNLNATRIKLFDFNLSENTYGQYTNGNALDVQSTNYIGSTTADMGNAITLLGGAFAGLKDIFTISILPGITLGLLIFLPVIVSIIVLIFKAVKK